MLHKITINPAIQTQKPTKPQGAIESNNLTLQLELSIKDISELVTCHTHTCNYYDQSISNRSEESWLVNSGFEMDFDNKDENKKPLPRIECIDSVDIYRRARAYGLIPNIIYNTWSSCEECPKTRIIFFFNEDITDINLYIALREYLYSIFPEADLKCKPISSFFYGGDMLIYVEPYVENSLRQIIDNNNLVEIAAKIKDSGSTFKVIEVFGDENDCFNESLDNDQDNYGSLSYNDTYQCAAAIIKSDSGGTLLDNDQALDQPLNNHHPSHNTSITLKAKNSDCIKLK